MCNSFNFISLWKFWEICFQKLRLTRWHDIRPEGRSICFDVSVSTDKGPVVLFDCHSMKGNQLFKYRVKTQQLYHPVSSLSLLQCILYSCSGERKLFGRKRRWRRATLHAKMRREEKHAKVEMGGRSSKITTIKCSLSSIKLNYCAICRPLKSTSYCYLETI